MTDWGAHHVDIASWALGMDKSGPLSLEGKAVHPVEFKDGLPTRDDQYKHGDRIRCDRNVSQRCRAAYRVPITRWQRYPIEGTDGRFHVSRGSIKGGVIEALKDSPLPEDALEKVYGGKIPRMHFENFVKPSRLANNRSRTCIATIAR